MFPSPTGGGIFRTYDWQINKVIKAAGVPKKGRKLHAFRHAAAVAAASGVWGNKWSMAEVARLLRDTSDAVRVYFDLLADAMQDKAAPAVPSMLTGWGLTERADGEIFASNVDSKRQHPR